MARITSEDCLRHVSSSFALVHAAMRRARQLQRGSKPMVDPKTEKQTVTALREIAAGLVEMVPLSEAEPELLPQKAATDEEEFAAILESPDLNVQLDAPEEEFEEEKPKRRGSKAKDEEAEEEDADGWDEEEEEEEDADGD